MQTSDPQWTVVSESGSATNSSTPTAAAQPAITTPQQAAALPPSEFQAMAYTVLHHQSQEVSQLAEQVRALVRAQPATTATAHGSAATPANSSSSSAVPCTPPGHLSYSLPFASPAEASWLDRLMSKGSHSSYYGEHSGQVLENWFNEYDLLFSVDRRFSPEPIKLLYAILHLKRDALRWYMRRENTRMSALPGSNPPAEFSSWEQLKTEMRAYFWPRGTSEDARRDLRKLLQVNCKSLDEYIARFQEAASRIDVPAGQSIEPELISGFKDGLKDGRVMLVLTQAKPRTLFEATQMACAADADLNASKPGPAFHGSTSHVPVSHRPWHFRPPARPFTSNHSAAARFSGHGSFGHRDAPGPVPMELGAVEEDDAAEWQVHEAERTQDSPANAESPHQADEAEPDDSPSSYAGHESASDRDEYYDPSPEANALFRPSYSRDRPRNQQGRFQPRSGQSARDRFLQKNNCYNCGQPGHLLVECPYQRGKDGGARPSSSALPASGQGAGQNSRGISYKHAKKV